MENYELTLGEYWRIIRKRKWTIAAVFVLVMLSTVIFTKMQTPIYEAALELKIERRQPVATPTVIEQAVANVTGDTNSLATDIRLITSLPVLRKVAEKMEVLPADQEEREKMLHAMALSYRDYFTVDQIRDTNILTIRARSSDPKKAALMATAVADVYGVENIKGRKKQTQALI
ncbi:MAG: hypothetical protein HY591_02900, partial [Candidatus Omnitrophica bacterium]|nr:hypothetical protein [Candidatus Omnitrophota bacterium]